MKIAIVTDGRDQRNWSSCEEASEWFGGYVAQSLGRVCDLLAEETNIDHDKIAKAFLGPSAEAR